MSARFAASDRYVQRREKQHQRDQHRRRASRPGSPREQGISMGGWSAARPCRTDIIAKQVA